ncbi:hypothetical protein AAVH_30877 [Aphelenchoides avenae]|nr:hypothetical protein AAVH_30877 [Aphelenchus avenae]
MSSLGVFVIVTCAVVSCFGRRPDNCTNFPWGTGKECPDGFEVKVDDEPNQPAFIYCCPKPTCFDVDDSCVLYRPDCDVENFTNPNEQVDPEWMKQNCAKTCGFCK